MAVHNGHASNPMLDYLREAKCCLTREQERVCDDFVIGLLSLHVSEQVWRDTVEMAVRLAKKGKAIGLKVMTASSPEGNTQEHE